MGKKTLLEFFGVEKGNIKKNVKFNYEVFGNSLLINNAQKKIIQKLIDLNVTPNSYNEAEIQKLINEFNVSDIEKSYLRHVVDNEVNGFGPLTDLINNDDISQIMVNGPQQVFVELDGKIIKDDNVGFLNREHIRQVLIRLLEPLDKKLEDLEAAFKVELLNKMKLSVIMPPITKDGPVFTIRKNPNIKIDIEELLRLGTLTPYMARFLEAAVLAKLNIIICGTSGSGKTTLLNALSYLVDESERLIVIDNNNELNIKTPNVVMLESDTQLTNITVNDLVSYSLNLRPDRLIIGELKGKETFQVMNALNTGIEGLITTMYAGSVSDALNRLETLILMDGIETSKLVIRNYIMNNIDLIVHIDRLSDGRRKVVNISEILAVSQEGIRVQEIFAFHKKGLINNNQVHGEFILFKYLPKTYEKIKAKGINTIKDIFSV
ncbi:MAG: ATPase, T2SS/T4P/T4SS family [Bacilli bacterium]|jgi:pilus assembly protein CpaF|nr:ATPase, T2SS/T4P/T4SS family [Bacilli bacterium]